MNSFERFNEEKLPAKKYFYSSIKDGKIGDDGKISDGHISVKDYLTCEKIWDKFEMKNMGDYHDHYLKKDVLLSVDVFEKVYCYEFTILWAWFLSLFRFSWIELGCYVKNDWCKNRKNIDIDKYLFIEKGLSGGISYIAKRYAKASNKYMNYYDPKKLSTFMSYLDMNNLYGWAMSIFLMVGLNG